MKQVVTETYTCPIGNGWNKCDVECSYEFNPLLVGKKQFEELVILNESKKKVITYWVSVANDGKGAVKVEKVNKQKLKYEKKQEEKKDLHTLKKERMERYAKQIAEQEEILFKNGLDRKTGEQVKLPCGIMPTSKDIREAMALQKAIGRSKNQISLKGL